MEVPSEERFSIVVPILWENIGRIAKAVDKEFGTESRNILRQVMGERGFEMGEMMKTMCPGEDFKSVGTFVAEAVKTFLPPDVKIEVEEKENKVSRCPYGLEGTSRELCKAMMAFDVKTVETIGPNVTLESLRP